MDSVIKVKDVITPINNYLRSGDGIGQATGYLRYIQLASLRILEEIDRVCSIADMDYFLAGGGLLGAARTGGFIPWDDDLDIFMSLSDYERFISVFNRHNSIDGLFATLHSAPTGVWNMIKVRHKSIPEVSVDVFCYEIMYRCMSIKERLAFTKQLQTLNVTHSKKRSRYHDVESYHKSFRDLTNENIKDLAFDLDCAEPTLFFSLGFCHNSIKCNAFRMRDMLPTRKISFENRLFNAPADIDVFLTYCFGDYLRLPIDPSLHVDVENIELEQALMLKAFISCMPEYRQMHQRILL